MLSKGKEILAGLIVGVAVLASDAVTAQVIPVPAPPRPPKTVGLPEGIKFPASTARGGVDSELRVSADANVSIKFCVSDGNLRVNGWDREEVRVFVRSGRKITARVLEKDSRSGKPSWIWLTAVTAEGSTLPASDCLSGSTLEFDVPVGTSVTIQGRSADVLVDSIKKASIKIVEGNISIRNVAGGISASALQGDLMVDNSGGAIMLESTTGNIFASDVAPGQVGDLFRSKTNSGAISLQRVLHRQIEANTITGSVVFDGSFISGGIYNFKTSNGAIGLTMPEASSCKIVASYGFGSFNSGLPLKYIYRNENSRTKNLAATLGSGELCSLNLITTSGSISLQKQ